MTQTFVRNFEIESLKKTLEMQQKTIGDESCVVWDAAIVLSKYLEILCMNDNQYLKDKKVIELGAGLGCASLVALCFGADVIMTDLPDVLPNLTNNIEHNRPVWEPCGGRAQVKPLSWGSDNINEFSAPDLLIAADCVYYEQSVEPLVNSMAALCGDTTEIIICQEEREVEKQRLAWEQFIKLFDKYFDYHKVPLKDQHALYSTEEIVIFRGKKKTNF